MNALEKKIPKKINKTTNEFLLNNAKPKNNTLKKIAFITRKLNGLYPSPPIPLAHKTPYQLLIAVLLSAQSTDKTVNRITPSLFTLASSPEKMAIQNEEDIYNIVKPCGLGRKKAPAIRQLSEILVNKYNGKVPKTIETLETLPGVGHKTASVVVSQAFGIAAFAVDTHVHRLAWRWGLSNGKSVVQTELHLKLAFPKKIWSRLHLQMIFFGREYCKAKNHESGKCPICKHIPSFME